MTLYAGETAQIRVSAVDFDQATALDASDVTSLTATIFDVEGEVVLAAEELSYVEDDGAWIYNWNTTGVAAGTYRAKIEAYGQGATPPYSVEFKRIRLNRRPVGG